MSKVTPAGPAGVDSETVNVNVVVPALPSLSETSLIVRLGSTTPLRGVVGTGGIGVGPTNPKCCPVGDAERGDRRGECGAVGGGVAVLGAGGDRIRRDE